MYDQDESIRFKIRSALGLKACECDIEKGGRDTYTIKPIGKKKELRIGTIKSIYGNNVRFHLFQLCNLIFENCIFDCKIGLQETAIDNKIIFENCTFHQAIHFNYATFSKPLIFRNTIFENFTYFFAVTFNGRVEFSECNFKKELNLSVSKFYQNIDIHNSSFQYANIKQTNFEREANFSNCKFQNEVNFSKSIFYEKANFEETIFKYSAYFDETIFKGIATFERSEFCGNAHFYQTEFSEKLDFFQTMFNEHLNLTDSKIHNEDSGSTDTPIFNFDFEGLKEKAQTCSDADKYRDVFKNIKNALINSGNLLGASRFRKMELYCKEIELDLKKKENKESSIRDTTDRIQLMFYRLTSDHHTDLLLILNNIIFLIALFACINLVLVVFSQYCDAISSILWSLISCIMFISMAIYFILELKIDRSYIDMPIKALLVTIELFIFGILSGICGIMVIFFIELIGIFETRIKRISMLVLSYLIVFFTLLGQPSLLLPILGKIMDNEKSNGALAFESLNIVYTIFLFLLLFSLQKTARKNTIVPN